MAEEFLEEFGKLPPLEVISSCLVKKKRGMNPL